MKKKTGYKIQSFFLMFLLFSLFSSLFLVLIVQHPANDRFVAECFGMENGAKHKKNGFTPKVDID